MKYYKITSGIDCDDIVKEDTGKVYTYRFGPNKWVRSGAAISDMRCLEIPEGIATKLLKEQEDKLNALLDAAIEVSFTAHIGQEDKGGEPYFLHPKTVAESVNSTEQKIVAYLHDICEDTYIQIEDLEDMGFPPRIINSIKVITKQKGVSYQKYLEAVRADNNARRVKIADIRHNMDISRIPHPSEKDFARIEKYKKAIVFLES